MVAEFTFSAGQGARRPPGEALPPPARRAGRQPRSGSSPARAWPRSGRRPAGVPALVVARVDRADGVLLRACRSTTARDYLLSLPGLPDDLAAQLRAFTGDGTTLPLPVPAAAGDHARPPTSTGTGDRARLPRRRCSPAWSGCEDGVVTGVAGSLSEDEVLAVARGLRLTPRSTAETARRSRPPSSCSPTCRRPRRCGAPACASGTDGGPRSTASRSPSAAARCSACSGPNGAGKTSVIKMLLGLVRPDAGEVLLLGRPGARPAARERVGYLPELFRYQPWLTAAEVLALHVRLAGVRVPGRRAARVRWRWSAWPTAPTTGWAASPRACSSGSGLAVALVARPGARRPRRADQRAGPARPGRRPRPRARRSRRAGVAVLLNSHLIGEVERVCDRVVILDRGRVAASGTLAELLGPARAAAAARRGDRRGRGPAGARPGAARTGD